MCKFRDVNRTGQVLVMFQWQQQTSDKGLPSRQATEPLRMLVLQNAEVTTYSLL
jgi:hypothetical protein